MMIDIKTGETLQTFDCIMSACRYLNIKNGSHISGCCHNKPKHETSHGYDANSLTNDRFILCLLLCRRLIFRLSYVHND